MNKGILLSFLLFTTLQAGTANEPVKFSDSEYQLISDLRNHPVISFEDLGDVIDFARMVELSGLPFAVLEPRVVRLIVEGEPVFSALDKAMRRELFHRWHVDIVKRVTDNPDKFITNINKLALTDDEKKRVINVYATCIRSFANARDREMMKPKICGDTDDYPYPKHQHPDLSVRSSAEINSSAHSRAYRSLMDQAYHVAIHYRLDTFERVIMSKCIAEQSLRFLVPKEHPLRALKKHASIYKQSPDEAFFMRTGVCSNFSTLSYSAALALGLNGKIFSQPTACTCIWNSEENGEWFHTHPFNSKSLCEINRFKATPKSRILPNAMRNLTRVADPN